MAQMSYTAKRNERGYHSSRQPYQRISNETREKVIHDITSTQNSIKQVALNYGLKYSTVNGIVQTYQQQGRCNKKEKRNKKQSYKRNKILITINQTTGQISLHHSQQNSNAILLESDQEKLCASKNNQIDCFLSSYECETEYVRRDIVTIMKNLVKKCLLEEQKIIQMNCISITLGACLNSSENMSKLTDEKYLQLEDDSKQNYQEECALPNSLTSENNCKTEIERGTTVKIENLQSCFFSKESNNGNKASRIKSPHFKRSENDQQSSQLLKYTPSIFLSECSRYQNFEEVQSIWLSQLRMMKNEDNQES